MTGTVLTEERQVGLARPRRKRWTWKFNPFPATQTERPIGRARASRRTVAQPPEAMRVTSRYSSPSSRSHAQSVVMRTTVRDLVAEHQHLTNAGGESETATNNSQ